MDFIFEKLTLAHKEDVIRIFNYYIKETTSAYRENIVADDFFLNFIDDEVYCGFAIKEKQGKLVGFCVLEPYRSYATFSEVAEPMYFIHHEYTGKGVGTLVLKKLEEEARKRGIKKLFVDISSENAGSINFHEKNGFVACGQLKNFGKKFGRHFSIVLMEKDICRQ